MSIVFSFVLKNCKKAYSCMNFNYAALTEPKVTVPVSRIPSRLFLRDRVCRERNLTTAGQLRAHAADVCLRLEIL